MMTRLVWVLVFGVLAGLLYSLLFGGFIVYPWVQAGAWGTRLGAM
jgi:hypothetical protein